MNSEAPIKHSFSCEIAAEQGIIAALLYETISFWVIKNQTDGKHFHNNKYWMYCSRNEFQGWYPYLSEKQIRLGLERLVKSGWAEVGKFSDDKFNHTNWYTIGKSIGHTGPVDRPQAANGLALEGQSRARVDIPDQLHTTVTETAVTGEDARITQNACARGSLSESYPNSAEEVMAIASDPRCGMPCTREQADEYFTVRASRDWVDAARRQISPGRVYLDLKCWLMGKKSGRIKPYDNDDYNGYKAREAKRQQHLRELEERVKAFKRRMAGEEAYDDEVR